MMWLFSKDANFGYNCSPESRNCGADLNNWILYDCKNKKGEEYSMFCFELTNKSPAEISQAQNCLKRLKTLRHPNMLTFVDSNETSKSLQIVTERVEPLNTYLKTKGDQGNFLFMTSWGLYQITKAILFLNDDCKLYHNNVKLNSVFVTRSGEWKLGGHNYVCTKEEQSYQQNNFSSTNPYRPPDGDKVDSWGLGCLIWEVYHTNGLLTNIQELRETKHLPPSLLKPYQGLLHPKTTTRTTVNTFFQQCSQQLKGFMKNFYVDTLLFLEEVHIKTAEEKKDFFMELGERVESFPDDIAKYKILPHLMNAFQYGGAGIEVLLPLLKLSKLLEQKEFEQSVVPCLVKMFSSQDRATRVKLLEHLPSFVDHLPDKVVSDQIFPPVSSGFADTHPLVRESTIRAMLSLAPKLPEKVMNDVLLKHLMHLQVKDEQGGIRANSTVCLAKLAPYFTDVTRQGVLLNGFLKCLRDPFMPAKQVAASAILSTLGYYGGRELACKVMPCVVLLTIDNDKEIRTIALRLCKSVLQRLEDANENPDLLNQVQSSEQGKSAASEMGWTNWAVSALSSKFLSRQPGAATTTTTAGGTSSSSAPTTSSTATTTSTAFQNSPERELSGKKAGGTTNDNESVLSQNKKVSSTRESVVGKKSVQKASDNNEGEKPVKKAPLKLGSKVKQVPLDNLGDSFNEWNNEDDQSFASSKINDFPTSSNNQFDDNQWDDFNDASFFSNNKTATAHQSGGHAFTDDFGTGGSNKSSKPSTAAAMSDWNADNFLEDFIQTSEPNKGKKVRPVLGNRSATTTLSSNTTSSSNNTTTSAANVSKEMRSVPKLAAGGGGQKMSSVSKTKPIQTQQSPSTISKDGDGWEDW